MKVESLAAGSATSPRAAAIEGSVQVLLEPARAALCALGAAILAVSLLTLPAANIFSNVCGVGLGSVLLHNFRAVKPTAAAATNPSLPAWAERSARGLNELITKPPAKRRSGCCSPKDVTGLAITTAVFAAGEMVAIGLAWWQLESIRPSLLLPLMTATEPVYDSWIEALLWRWLASALAMGAGSAFVHIVLAGVACTAMSALVKAADAHVQASAHAVRTQELLRAAGVTVDDPRLLTGDPQAQAASGPGAPVPVLRSVSKRGMRGADTPPVSVSAHAAALRRMGSSGRSASMSLREAALRGSVATEPGLSSYEREALGMAGGGNGGGNGSFRVVPSGNQPPRSSPLSLTSPTASFSGRLHTIHESSGGGGGGDTSHDHYGPGDHDGGMGGRATVTASSTAAPADRDRGWDRDGGGPGPHTGSRSLTSPQGQALPFLPPLQMQQVRGSNGPQLQPQSQVQPQPQMQPQSQGPATMSDVRTALQRIRVGSMRMAAPASTASPSLTSLQAQQGYYDDALAGSAQSAPQADAAVEAALQSAVQKLAAASMGVPAGPAGSESPLRPVQRRGSLSGIGFSDSHSPLTPAPGVQQVVTGGGAATAAAVYRAPSLADLVHAVRVERAAGRM